MTIELTSGQINELAYMFTEHFNNEIKIDAVKILETGTVQIFYTDGKPKVKDISIYD